MNLRHLHKLCDKHFGELLEIFMELNELRNDCNFRIVKLIELYTDVILWSSSRCFYLFLRVTFKRGTLRIYEREMVNKPIVLMT